MKKQIKLVTDVIDYLNSANTLEMMNILNTNFEFSLKQIFLIWLFSYLKGVDFDNLFSSWKNNH